MGLGAKYLQQWHHGKLRANTRYKSVRISETNGRSAAAETALHLVTDDSTNTITTVPVQEVFTKAWESWGKESKAGQSNIYDILNPR